MNGKVQLESIDLRVYTGKTFYTIIDIFKFVKDSDLKDIQVFIVGDEDAYLDEISPSFEVENTQELTKEALKWIIRNVDIVDRVVEE